MIETQLESAPAPGGPAVDLVPADDPRVAAECNRVLYSQAATTFAGNLAFALVLAALFRGHVPGAAMALWLGVIASLLVARFALSRALSRPARAPGRWAGAYTGISLAVGACWGAASMWLLPVSDRVAAAGGSALDLKLLLIMLLFGISAGAVAALYPKLWLAWGFMLMVMLPELASVAFTGSHSDQVLFVMGLGYVLVMMRIAASSNATLLSSLRARFAAGDMAARLEQANAAGEVMNRELASMRDKALRALQHKSEFLATMSHEIRTPLNGMLGMLELIEEGDLKARERRFAGTARLSGEALLAIINDVLDFSRIEAGKLELEPRTFDLRDLVEDVGALFAERAQRKGLELIASLPCAGPCLLEGDDARLRQILINLVGNAVKFTEHGTVELRATPSRDAAGESAVLFEITDTGIGIGGPSPARVFKAFAQADASTTRRFGGSGLGLAICARLVRLMGGEIDVDSAPGEGSRFWFRVPLPVVEGAGAAPAGPALPTGCGPVLIAVPCALARAHLLEQFICWGVEARAVADVPAAVACLEAAAAQARPFRLLLLDRGAARGGSAAAARAAVRDLLAVQEAPRVALLCAVHELAPDDEVAGLGVSAQIVKPVRAGELLRCLAAPGPTPAGGEPVAATREEAPPPGRLSGRVLLAEDGPVNIELGLAMLGGLGLEVDVARTGREAVDAVTARRYDLVLMDWQMPEMDGLDAARAIREFEDRGGRASRVPIVAVTANAMNGDEAKCLQAGMDGYMSKPFRKRDLAAVCVRWMKPPRQAERWPEVRQASA